MSAGRSFLAAAVTVLACAAMLVTLLAEYANHVLINSAGFSSRAVSVVQTGPVESLIAGTVTDRLLAYVGNEVGADGVTEVQPVIADAVSQALSNQRITGEIRESAQSLQSQLLYGQANALTLTLPDAGSAIASSISSTSPELADEVTRIGTITVLDVPIPADAAQAIHDLATVGQDSSLLIVLTVALAALALLVSANRRRTIIGLGLGVFVSGLLAAAAYLVGRGIVLNEFSSQDARTAAGTAWSVYMGGVELLGFVVAGAGAVIAFTATVL